MFDFIQVFLSPSQLVNVVLFSICNIFVFSPVAQIQKQSSENNLGSFRQSSFFEYLPGRDALQNMNRKKQLDFAWILY